ncbi:hypothetical protein LXL04_028677 [Taraxacum kok-saghyz]
MGQGTKEPIWSVGKLKRSTADEMIVCSDFIMNLKYTDSHLNLKYANFIVNLKYGNFIMNLKYASFIGKASFTHLHFVADKVNAMLDLTIRVIVSCIRVRHEFAKHEHDTNYNSCLVYETRTRHGQIRKSRLTWVLESINSEWEEAMVVAWTGAFDLREWRNQDGEFDLREWRNRSPQLQASPLQREIENG